MWGARLMRGYGLTSLASIGVYPLLPESGRAFVFFVVCVSAIPCVAFGRRSLPEGKRLPWTLLMASLLVIVVANVLVQAPDERTTAVGWLLDAAGNVVALAAALALVARRGVGDLGGIIDASVIALAVGGLLWGMVLPHQLGPDRSAAAQVNLFVVVFALTGVLGALVRLSISLADAGTALRWLMVALAVGIVSNSILAIAGANPVLHVAAEVLFMAAFVALGLFGLDPTAPRLMSADVSPRAERLTAGRLVFLGLAVAVAPVVAGVRELLGRPVEGLLLAVQGALVAVLVMLRVGMLSAQRARAERALVYQAAHDPLTNLPNRRTLIARLSRELARGSPCVLVFCDLDNFKTINDRLGHTAGDRLLIEVANRISSCVPRPHMVSRFGGDEFVILLVDTTSVEAQATRRCIADAVARPFEQAGDAPVSVSIGLARTDEGRDPEQLIRAADRDMYQVKAARRRQGPR